MQIPKTFSPALLFACAALFVVGAPPAAAQRPSIGDFYEDSVTLGFKVRMPKGWVFAPPQPGEPNTLGTYQPPHVKYINISPNEVLWLEAHLVKFDRRPKEEPEPEAATRDADGRIVIDPRRMRPRPIESLSAYLERHFQGSGAREIDSGEFRVRGVQATERLFKAAAQRGTEFHIWAVVYELEPDLEVAMIFNAPDSRDWRTWQGNLRRMGQSFQRVAIPEREATAARSGDSAYRTQKRDQLALEVARNPNWSLDETDNYFIVSGLDDPAFLRELKLRLEAIRAVYEELYPAEQAERIRFLAEERAQRKKDAPATGPAAPEGGELSDDEDEKEVEIVFGTTTGVSSRDLSRCSVVRVCANRQQYEQYGGPPGSAGYWNWATEELVVFDDKAVGGRRNTWAVLNHEAFHQYIFYFYGNISPHSWYNEGTGDFFGGYQLQANRFVLRKFDWRVREIQQGIRNGTYVPLKDFVRFTQAEYYARTKTKYGTTIGDHYAQGWAFIYFLRTGKGRARGWNNDWDHILDTYLETLAATRDLDQAVDAAFAGVDWEKLEESWKNYTL